MDTLDNPTLLQLVLWHSADTIRSKVCVSGLQRKVWFLTIIRKSYFDAIIHNYPENYPQKIIQQDYLDATKATEVFITLLLPLGNQVWVGNLLLCSDFQIFHS